ncbi:LuxR family two component transcriptional regulator [Flavobacterium sp. 103]|uniref:response regulator transcription factor n=1 Tax=unclassified Flavobacterium TaxID=196869 RepID=UPI000D5D005C|nr:MULTISPECIES: response regulator transcription factor [unclassified Flavobacterium]PVX44713.1 LuxR family two component transcriptional regulator [Flavobacterium sp. 103]QKJ63139.1 response regulator transcription factor [Flavobacterium sp. M31R6]
MTKNIRIHLADDHQIILHGIQTLLQTIPHFEVVGSSLNGTTIYDDVTKNKADVLVLDISMPEKDGIEVVKEFAQKGFPCKVIILSSYDDLKLIKEIMDLGVSGYLTKQCAGDNIIEAVQAVADGEEYFCESIREKIFSNATKNNPKLNTYKPNINPLLTEREIEIIILIALEYSGKEISEQLFISINTVETHRKNIMKKLKAKNTIGIVKYAMNNHLIIS